MRSRALRAGSWAGLALAVLGAAVSAASAQKPPPAPARPPPSEATRPAQPPIQRPIPFTAAPDESTFAAANRAYKQGRLEEAIQRYEALVTSGVVHEDLFYNLGNAYFRAGQVGPAIFNYERALRIDPGDGDARYNMKVARQTVAERVVDRLQGAESDPWWVRLATYFSISQLTIAFLVIDFAFFAILVALLFLATGFLRTALIATAAVVGVAMVGSLVLLRVQVYVLEEVHQGIVIADQVIMREGADPRSAERGKLHPGVRVRLRGREPNWVRIGLANGMEGWVPADSIGRL